MSSFLLTSEEADASISKFIELVKFPTVSGDGPHNGSYKACGNFILGELKSAGLDSFILQDSVENKPIVIATWVGSDPTLPSILLNSHYDVVPVVEEKWTVPAFEGFKRDNKIYGRGTQDMKCVCMQYITAIQKLVTSGHKPLRTIHLSFVPDEETGGQHGMNILLASDWFSTVTLELALDEGLASENHQMSVFYGERIPWWVKVTATGNTGHASRFIEGECHMFVLRIMYLRYH
jgi:aminoacylase